MTQPPYSMTKPSPQGPPAGGSSPHGQPYPPMGWGQQPPKPPFYKKPWVIVLGVLLAIGVIGSAVKGGDTETTSSASSTTSSSAVASTVAPPPPTTQAAVPPPAAAAPTTQAPPAVVNFTMPNFVGMDLQSAQNLVQTFGPFFSRSHDLLGSRNQAVDSNWMVCDQNIPAGQQVTGNAEGLIDFGVVKREESCP